MEIHWYFIEISTGLPIYFYLHFIEISTGFTIDDTGISLRLLLNSNWIYDGFPLVFL
jgi:hypothetical protein